MLQRAFYGPPQEKFNDVPDADTVEKDLCIFCFVAAILLVGFYPAILTNIYENGHRADSKIAGIARYEIVMIQMNLPFIVARAYWSW